MLPWSLHHRDMIDCELIFPPVSSLQGRGDRAESSMTPIMACFFQTSPIQKLIKSHLFRAHDVPINQEIPRFSGSLCQELGSKNQEQGPLYIFLIILQWWLSMFLTFWSPWPEHYDCAFLKVTWFYKSKMVFSPFLFRLIIKTEFLPTKYRGYMLPLSQVRYKRYNSSVFWSHRIRRTWLFFWPVLWWTHCLLLGTSHRVSGMLDTRGPIPRFSEPGFCHLAAAFRTQ